MKKPAGQPHEPSGSSVNGPSFQELYTTYGKQFGFRDAEAR